MSPIANFLSVFSILLSLFAVTSAYPYAYNMPRPGSMETVSKDMVNKVLVQSPPLDNVYMDYLVTSKPLSLRKYNTKTKKNKKDSKIYFIPIPPLPYRYIPGIGYDYQPMKIKPILQDAPSSSTTSARPTAMMDHSVIAVSTSSTPTTAAPAQSKLFRVQHHKDYYFNGRPFRLQAAHAGRKSALTPLNLKSRFYYNKNIIY